MGLKAGFRNEVMRSTQGSEYYLYLKRDQTSAVYSAMSGRASSPTAETAKNAQCHTPMQTADE
jgi:hypothetical protein